MRRHRMLAKGDILHPNYRAVLQEAVSLGYAIPSLNQQIAQSKYMEFLVSSTIFGYLDVIYFFQNDCGLDFTRINWKSPSQFRLTDGGSLQPMWHRNLGVSGRPDTPGSCWFNTGYIPSVDGVNWVTNGGGIFGTNLSGYAGCGYFAFTESGTSNMNRSNLYLFDSYAGWGMNQTQSPLGLLTAAQHFGMHSTDRTASNSVRYLNNGSTLYTQAITALSRSATQLTLFGFDTAIITPPYHQSSLGASFPVQCIMAGAALSGAMQVSIRDALVAYKNTIHQTFSQTVTGNFTVPANVNKMFVECWGGGGAGLGFPNATAVKTGGGGAGGGYSASLLDVSPGQIIPYVIGAGGVGNALGTTAPSGADTSWNGGQILAKGGAGAPAIDVDHANGGSAAAGVGQIKYSGGGGGSRGSVLNASTGSGGSAAGALGNGVNGVDAIVGSAVGIRTLYTPLGGGNPGYVNPNTFNGVGPPGVFGAGGGGARRTLGAPVGGNGGQGYIRISIDNQA